MYFSENEGSGLEEGKEESFSDFAKNDSPAHESPNDEMANSEDTPIRLGDLSSLGPSKNQEEDVSP